MYIFSVNIFLCSLSHNDCVSIVRRGQRYDDAYDFDSRTNPGVPLSTNLWRHPKINIIYRGDTLDLSWNPMVYDRGVNKFLIKRNLRLILRNVGRDSQIYFFYFYLKRCIYIMWCTQMSYSITPFLFFFYFLNFWKSST